jgi:hypothetical protein
MTTNARVVKPLSAVLPAELHAQLVARSEEEDRSISSIVRIALTEHLSTGTQR